MRRVSVVIPTFGRGPSILDTLRALLSSDIEGLTSLEVIVVDDGSPVPVEPLVADLQNMGPAKLICVRQNNLGPAAARNAGFRRARGDTVLFLDDDILVPPDLVRRHVEAHEDNPGTVIFGRSTFLNRTPTNAVFRVLERLGYEDWTASKGEYARVSTLASGQLSVERAMFDSSTGVYRDDLVTPAAEEYELSMRLRRRGIPILLAGGIVAYHDSPTGILGVCRQQYKHGLGCGEVAIRCPETGELEELARIRNGNWLLPADNWMTRLSKVMRMLAAGRLIRLPILTAARIAERIAPQWDDLAHLYRWAIALHFIAGLHDAVTRFTPPVNDKGNTSS